MGIRMSGLVSGLDTEAIVGALMSAQSLKKTKIVQNKTKLEWKQEKWKELNTKLYKLYTDHVSKLQLQSSYMTKKASVSDASKAKVTAGNDAVTGSYSLKVNHIATSQYLTGGKLNDVTSTSKKLSEIDPGIADKEIKIEAGGKTTYMTITDDMTIADFTKRLKDAGLNASYDTTQKRFFISSKESGLSNAFSITSVGEISSTESAARNTLRTAAGYGGMNASQKEAVDSAIDALWGVSGTPTTSDINAAVDKIAKAMYDSDSSDTKSLEGKKTEIRSAIEAYAAGRDKNLDNPGSQGDGYSALSGLGLSDIEFDGTGYKTDGSTFGDIAFIAASDSEIILNGAKLTSSSAVVKANGLSIELTGLTGGEEITFSVTNDTEGVYNSIKSFLKEYNEIMKEMNTLYSAKPAKGYNPLSNEAKEKMSEKDIELYENKIKDSLLRSDTTLGGIMSGMRSAMQSQVQYNGKTYSLASFGIMTSFDYTEGGQYHIYGDSEDSVYADREDKLRKALEEDPDAVMHVLTDIFANLKTTMSEKMATSKVSSAFTFYNDKKMKEDLEAYEKDIKKWEDKLAAMEDSYYAQFTRMEKAMAKLQSQQSYLAGIFNY